MHSWISAIWSLRRRINLGFAPDQIQVLAEGKVLVLGRKYTNQWVIRVQHNSISRRVASSAIHRSVRIIYLIVRI